VRQPRRWRCMPLVAGGHYSTNVLCCQVLGGAGTAVRWWVRVRAVGAGGQLAFGMLVGRDGLHYSALCLGHRLGSGTTQDRPPCRVPYRCEVLLRVGGGFCRRKGKRDILRCGTGSPESLLPLIVRTTPPRHHLNRYPVPEWVSVPFGVRQQVYLNPYAKELVPRNHV
jgi:hypothetical protein